MNINNSDSTTTLPPEVLALLQAEGFEDIESAYPLLSSYVALVQDWNERASLVSVGDSKRLWETHIPDSLSLAAKLSGAVAGGAQWLDIGPGGGFPSIPVRILCGKMPMLLCERSVKKADILRQMLTVLCLDDVEVVAEDFPRGLPHGGGRWVITARAVERAPQLHESLSKWMAKGDVFLCQAAEVATPLRSKMFHVEPLEDAWTDSKLRRGKLWRVRRL
jgi:16S rRNA (guanine527-N7)-methyltransferase